MSRASQNSATMSTIGGTSEKRYTCPHCPYGTDRRDLYTRHENIHREEKPFECYECHKPFNRADHVKKHFLRMHRELVYELARIRRVPGSSAANNNATGVNGGTNKSAQQDNNTNSNGVQQHANNYAATYNNNKNYQLQTGQSSNGTGGAIYQSNIPVPGIVQADPNCAPVNRRMQNGGCASKSHGKTGSKAAGERR